jgi:hypothetical protein
MKRTVPHKTRPSLRDQSSRNRGNRKRSLVGKCGRHSKNRIGKKPRGRKQGDGSRVSKKRHGLRIAGKSRVDKRLAGHRMKDAMRTAESAFPRTAFAPSSDESTTSKCVGPRS